MPEGSDELKRIKEQLRVRARARRRRQENREALSRRICRKLAALPEYHAAATLMSYVDIASEVRTRQFLSTARDHGKRVAVPYCAGDRLELFRFHRFDELAPGTRGILEPLPRLRSRGERKVGLDEVDLVVVPGVAFDRRGGRIGQGKGYYDRLLRLAPPDTTLVALAFECQLVDEIPMLPHDVYMHKVITEEAIYEGNRWTPSPKNES